MELIVSLLLSFGVILVLQDETNAAKYSMSEASNLLLKAQLCQNIPEIDVSGNPLSGTPPFKTSVFLVQGSNDGHVLAAEINATHGFTFNLMVVQALNQNGIPSGHFIHYPCRDPRENRGRHYIESYCSRQGQNDEVSQKWGTTRLMYSLPYKNRKQEFLTSDGVFWLWLPNPPNTQDMLSLKDGNSPPKQIQFVFTVARTFKNGTSQYYTDIRTPLIEFHHSFEPIEMMDEFGSERCYANPLNNNQSTQTFIKESQFKIPINPEYWKSIVEKGNTTEPPVTESTPTTTEESTETTGYESATTNVPEAQTTPALEVTSQTVTSPSTTEECTETTESESTTPTLEVTSTTEECTETTESETTTPPLEVTSQTFTESVVIAASEPTPSTTEDCTETTESESTTPTVEVTSTTEECTETTESETTTPALEVTSKTVTESMVIAASEPTPSTTEECTETTESESTTPTLEVTSTTEECTETTESESATSTLAANSTESVVTAVSAVSTPSATEDCTETIESESTISTLEVTSTTEECTETTESESATSTPAANSTESVVTAVSAVSTPSATEDCTETIESESTISTLEVTSTTVTESVVTAVSEPTPYTTEEHTETAAIKSTTTKVPEFESTPTLRSTTSVTESVVTKVPQTSQPAFTEPTDASKPRPTLTSVPLPDNLTGISEVRLDVEVEIIEEWEEELYVEVEIEVAVEPIVALFYEGCKTRKGCLEDRPGCVQDMNCKAMVSFSKWHDNHPDYFHFQLIGIHDGIQGYVAVGFSMDQYMGEDSVIECIANSDGTVGVFESWNEKNRQNSRLEGSSCGTTNFSSTHTCNVYVVNGAIYCEFFKRSKTVIKGKVFDLDEGSFHLLRAYGGALQDIRTTEEIVSKESWEVEIEETEEISLRRKRSTENSNSTKEAVPKSARRQATISREPYKTASESRSQINPNRKLGKHKKHFATTRSINLAEDIELEHDLRPQFYYTKLHGIFMIVAWIVFIPNAHFIVRYFQESWVDVTYFGKAYWFFVHLTLVILAGSFCCIATFSSILNLILEKKRWPSGDEEIIHSVLGSISLLLLVVQFVTGIIRHKKPKWKKSLDIIHLISGVTSYLIAASLIASAHTIPFTYIPCSSFLLIIVWVIMSILMHLVITVQICQKQREAKNKMPPTVTPSPSQAQLAQLAQQNREKEGARFRLVVYAFHAAGAAIVGTLLTLPYIFSITGCDCLFCFTI